MTTQTAPAVNPFEVSHSTRDRWHLVTDTRTGQPVKTFFWEDNAALGPASVRARQYADSRWHTELLAQPEVAPEPTPDDLALAHQWVAELNQLEPQMSAAWREGRAELHASLSAYYNTLSDKIRALGFEIGPDASGGYALMNRARTEIIPVAAPELDQHALNQGRQYLLTWQERPDLWRAVWATLSEREQDAVLSAARATGATPYQLSSLAGLDAFHDSTPRQSAIIVNAA